MDFYFTDRKFNVLGIASAGGSGPIKIVNDIDDQMAPNSVGRSYSGTLITDPTNSAKLAEMAALGNFVLYQDQRGKYVFATVMDWPEPGYDPQSGELDFVAENGGIDLINETVGAYKATKAMPIADYIKLFTADSGFEIGTNEITSLTRTLEWDSTDETALARIESVATQFDNAELDFRFEIDGTAVVKRYIDIYKHIGSDKGQRLEVNTQVNSIKTTGNIYDLFTSIEATGGTPEGKDAPINLKGYKWTDPDGRYVLGADGVLRDTVAVQLWSRTLSNDNPTPTNHHIQRVKTYEATTQASLVQSALADLKQSNHASINYVVDVADLPDQVQVGDTVHLVDEAQGLNLSARLLELKDSYANDTHEATLGDYLIEANQVDPALQEVADQLKTLKQTAHWYPWTRYADDNQGTGMSSLPLGKEYMAVVWGNTATPSDDPSDYAGHWQKVTGTDGADGQPGPAGADGRTSYFHTAWADSLSGSVGFTTSGGNGKAYVGTYSDFTQADSTDPSRYNWALFKGPKGDNGSDGVAGKDGIGLKSTAIAYQIGSSGTTKPTGTWSATVPTLTKGQYLWTKTTWTYSDNTTEDGFSVSYIAKDGSSGSDGLPGKDGVGISNTVIEYAGAVSGTSSPTSGWSTTIPTVPAGQYLWTRTTWSYSDGTSEQGYSTALMGKTGATGKDGLPGKDGVGLKSTQIMYAQSTSGTTAPTTGWTAQVPTLIKGQYLWTQTTWVYTDNTGEAGYTVSYNAKDGNDGTNGVAGKDGVGIKTTTITYADSTNGTTAPTIGFTSAIPTVDAGNYLWTKTIWTYTDGTSETGYSVAMMGNTGPAGKDGSQGVAGKAGADGKTPYLHTAWSWSSDGKDRFTVAYPGENILPNSSNFGLGWSLSGKPVVVETAKEQGGNVVVVPENGNGSNALACDFSTNLSGGTSLNFSFLARTDTAGAQIHTELWGGGGSVNQPLTTEWVRYTRTGPLDGAHCMLYFWGVGVGKIYIALPKLSTGDVSMWTPAPSEDPTNAYPLYRGEYTDYTEADSTDPTKYTWAKVKGETGQQGIKGDQGERGKQIFKSSYEGQPNQAGRNWFDLSPAPSVDNPPKIGDTVITPAGNIFQIDTVTVGGGGGGGSFGVGDVLGNIQGPQGPTGATGPQGPKGNDITSYASGMTLPSTVAPANSQFWLVNSNNIAIKFYKSTGSAWVEQQISASAINAATFNGLTFNGVTFNGSTFASANSRVIDNGEEELYTAGTTLTNTQTLDKMGYTSVAHGSIMGDTTPNSFKAMTTISNTGSIRSRADFASGDWSIITIDPTQSAMTMSNSQNTSGTLNADYLSRVNNCGLMLWSGTVFLNEKQTLTPSVAINKCLNGWMLEWQEYKNGSAAGTDVLATPIYSRMVARLSGTGFNLPMAAYNGASFNKYCYPTNTTLTGNAKNGTAGSSAADYVLTAIFAF